MFKFQIGDKTTIIDQTRRNLALKTIRRKNPEPRGTLKPLWSINPDGTIVYYTPQTITIDIHNQKNTVIQNCDIAISSEKRQKPPEPKLRLINFVACKTVGEYIRNKRKQEKFCLAEKARTVQPKRSELQAEKLARLEQPTTSKLQMPTTSLDAPGPSSATVTTTSHQQGTSTPIDDNEATPLAAN